MSRLLTALVLDKNQILSHARASRGYSIISQSGGLGGELVMPKMTSAEQEAAYAEQEAAYALKWNLDRSHLSQPESWA
jgi:hypothetical protein